MKRKNIPLIIGSIILLTLLLVMLLPDLFTDNSPYSIQLMRFSHEGGTLSVERAPFPPDKDFLLGSDDLGRDIFSYIIYGTRLTLSLGLLIAIGQFMIAIPIALLGGFGNRLAKTVILQFNIIFSAIPALLISIILLKLEFIVSLGKQNSIIAFVAILTAVSWPKLGSIVMERVEAIIQQPFIKGETAIGKRKLKIALENILPHLAPELIILFFMEVARNLSMIMQLGIFAIFVGNLGIINDQSSGALINTDISFEPEWASMLSTSRTLISTAPWAVIFPALAFFISVLGFNLFGEGLRNLIQRKDSRMTLVFRKLISLDFSYLWKMVGKKEKIRYTLTAVALLGSLTLLRFASAEDYSVSIDLPSVDLPNQVIIGTNDAEDTMRYIADKMNDLGIEPLKGDSYLMSYDIGGSYMIKNQILSINSPDGLIYLKPNQDFAFISSSNSVSTGTVYDATREDMFNIKDFTIFEEKFILIDKAYYNDQSINYFIDSIAEHVKIKGILLIARNGEVINSLIVDESSDMSSILVSRDISELLKASPDLEISVSSSVMPLKSIGNNLVGIFRGEDENIGDEAIVIGMNYNYITDSGSEVLQFNLKIMEQLCKRYENKRSLIFMFLDGTINENRHGIKYVTQDFPYSPNKIQLYIDLTGLIEDSFDYIEFSSAQAPVTRQFAWSIGYHLEEEFNKYELEFRELETVAVENEYYFSGSDADNVMFWDRGIPTIIVNTPEPGQKEHSIEDVGNILLRVVNKSNY